MCQSEKSKGHARQSISIFIQQVFIEPLLCVKHSCRYGGYNRHIGKHAPLEILSHPLQKSPFCLTHAILCLCSSYANVGIYCIWNLTGKLLFFDPRQQGLGCFCAEEGVRVYISQCFDQSCYMRTPWKCNLSSPRHQLGLTICLRPQSDWGLSLAEHPCMGEILTQAYAK